MKILLSMNEAIVLSEALSSSMLYMAFGIPKVFPRSEKYSGARQPLQSGGGC
jgi:hypothetical protein